jgi:hypothetical protein
MKLGKHVWCQNQLANSEWLRRSWISAQKRRGGGRRSWPMWQSWCPAGLRCIRGMSETYAALFSRKWRSLKLNPYKRSDVLNAGRGIWWGDEKRKKSQARAAEARWWGGSCLNISDPWSSLLATSFSTWASPSCHPKKILILNKFKYISTQRIKVYKSQLLFNI